MRRLPEIGRVIFESQVTSMDRCMSLCGFIGIYGMADSVKLVYKTNPLYKNQPLSYKQLIVI